MLTKIIIYCIVIIDMTQKGVVPYSLLAETRERKARDLLNKLIGEDKESIVALVSGKFKEGEAMEYISANALIPFGPGDNQGAVVELAKRMSMVEKLSLLGDTIGRRKVVLDWTIGNRKITIRARALILKNPVPIFGRTKNKGGFLVAFLSLPLYD